MQNKFWQTIIITVLTAICGAVTGYFGGPHKVDPVQEAALHALGIEGKWKYICTSFDGTYQHGGRLIIQKSSDGSFILNGERTWRDTKDTISGKWTYNVYRESDYGQWSSTWIFVKNNSVIRFEYEMPMQSITVKGYCTGIVNSKDNMAQEIKGNFYVLNNKPILTGQIIFKRVTDDDFNSASTLPKNHD